MDPIIIPIVGMAIPIVIAPVAIAFKYAQAARQLEHAERMKAMELGRTLPQDEPWWSPPRIAVAIGAGVPIGVFFCAWLASESIGYQPAIWMAAMIVGVAGVGCGSALATRYLAHRERTAGLSGSPFTKPAVDQDAYDFVGSRG